MYTENDLKDGIRQGIFTKKAVLKFQKYITSRGDYSEVDKEGFHFIAGFNDVFVASASILLLFSILVAAMPFGDAVPITLFTISAWGLAELFLRKSELALTSIVLVGSFVGGMFFSGIFWVHGHLHTHPPLIAMLVATVVAMLSTWIHWKRFHIPITLACGVLPPFLLLLYLPFYFSQGLTVYDDNWFLILVFMMGVTVFTWAMWWDISDLERGTERSDIAFWLHLIAAPMVVHPLFYSLGMFDEESSLMILAIAITYYLFIILVSLIIDRRAFMLSSLIYLLTLFSAVLKSYGVIYDSLALAGIIFASALLILSTYWHQSRLKIMEKMPVWIQNRVPKFSS
jgi:hypothetical protein